VTPFDVPDSANPHADVGKPTSSGATGASHGQPAVDSRSIASTAPDNGLDVAPAAADGDQVPTSVPADAHSSGNADEVSKSSNAPDDPGPQNLKVLGDPGPQSGKAPDDPAPQNDKAPGDPGPQDGKAPDHPGPQNDKVPGDPAPQNGKAPDDPGPQNLQVSHDPGSGASGHGGRGAQSSGCAGAAAQRACPVSASGSTTTKRKG